MTYQTMDWNAEAKRVALAFDVEGECEFRNLSDSKKILRNVSDPNTPFRSRAGDRIEIYFENKWRRFILYKNRESNSIIWLSWDMEVSHIYLSGDYTPLTRALFYLDLLTTEVEAALNFPLTAHQKIEWALEYEQRIKAI